VTINLVKHRISCLCVGSKPLLMHVLSIMSNNSFMGMFVYMLEMSSDANLRTGVAGMFAKSFISRTEF